MQWIFLTPQLFELHAPYKTVRIKKRHALWLTDNPKLLIKLKRRAHLRYRQNKTDAFWREYGDLRNFVNYFIRAEKKTLLNHKSKSDPKNFS